MMDYDALNRKLWDYLEAERFSRTTWAIVGAVLYGELFTVCFQYYLTVIKVTGCGNGGLGCWFLGWFV